MAKYLCFCFEGGAENDKTVISMLDKYKLKATFALNPSESKDTRLILSGGKVSSTSKVKLEEYYEVYKNHEVCLSEFNHKSLIGQREVYLTKRLGEEKSLLSELTRKEVYGYAYPGGFKDQVVKNSVNKLGFTYAFDLAYTSGIHKTPMDIYNFIPSANIFNDEFMIFFKGFLNSDDCVDGTDSVFLAYGQSQLFFDDLSDIGSKKIDKHSKNAFNEVPKGKKIWDRFDNICKLATEYDDIIVLTCAEYAVRRQSRQFLHEIAK